MNRSEFKKWLAFHQGLFPEVGQWFQEHGSDAVLDAWEVALAPVDYDDAMACTKRMVAGHLDHPNRFEISRLPAAIIRGTPFRVQSAQELKGKQWNPVTGDIT